MSSVAYYNEIDPYAAQWLRNLIAAGHIAPGVVDERSIEDVRPIELAGYTQCHFFAGIGAWSLALRRAGWPDDRPVWTGSCPCQPFSTAGKGGGFDDERHLWPAWQWLIGERKPPVVFGEQVASAIKHGWLDLVREDLGEIGYAFGACSFPASGVGAPHTRQRVYFVADSAEYGCERLQRCVATQVQKNGSLKALDAWHGTGDPFEQWEVLLAGTGVRKMDDGVSSTMVVRPSLRAYGNAIVPQAAEEFIRAFLDCKP